MALIDKASLLMVPSTYEAGKLYNVLPSGNRAPDNKGGAGYDQTRADFDFDRGSNAAASRINSSGLIEKYRENSVLYSNGFNDAVWAKVNALVTSGQTDKDGGTDAWLLTKSAASGRIQQLLSPSGVQTYSVYAKAGTLKYMRLRTEGTTNPSCFFDFTNGTIHNNDGFAASMEDVGGGWYRCSYTIFTAVTRISIYPADGTGSVSGGSGSIYIQSAQLESGLVATDYLNSTSVTAKAGVLIDLPRINYDANGENGALLLEPSRQNLVQYSEYFGAWSDALGCDIYNNTAVSPEGVQNAATISFGGSADSRAFLSVSASSSTYIFSIYAKSSTSKKFRFRISGSGGTQYSADLTTTSEWKRFEFEYTGDISVVGLTNESSAAGGSVNFYGFQAESGSYVSSYIPNHSGTGGVTRAADSCSVTGASDVIGGTSGTIFFDIKTNKTLTSTNYKQFFYYSGVNSASSYMYISGNNYIVGNPSLGNIVSGTQLEADTQYKVAITYKQNDFKLYINGSLSATRTSGSVIDAVDITSIGSYNGVSEFNEFQFNQYAHFQEVLSDSELATLTTL